MKSFLGLLLCGTLSSSASLTAPPKIELSLAGSVVAPTDRDYAMKCEATLCADEQCVVEDDSGKDPCPKLTAKAWDAWQGDLSTSVTVNIRMVDDDGAPVNKVVFQSRQSPNDAITPFGDNDFLKLRNKRASYVFEYDCTDDEDNAAEKVTVAFVVNDITAPVFTMDTADVTVEAGDDYTFPTVTAEDDIDGNVSQYITATMMHTAYHCDASAVECTHSVPFPQDNKLDTTVLGTYIVTYHVHDEAGTYGEGMKNNVATISRKFTVKDDTVPTIALNGNDEIVQCGTVYNDLGANATDSHDGTLNVHTTSDVNPNVPGTYTVSYVATDSVGNSVTASRTVTVHDTLNPHITLRGPNTIVLHAQRDTYDEPGVEYNDKCTSHQTLSTKFSENWINDLDTAKVGTYEKEYSVEDEAGLSATITRTIDVVDVDIPIINVVDGDLNIAACSDTNPGATACPTGETEYTDPGAHCTDTHDGVINKRVITDTPSIAKDRPGTYVVQYDCKDYSNNSAITMFRKVVVYDDVPPVLTINPSSTEQWEAGYEYTPPVATAIDNLDGNISQFVQIEGLAELQYAALHHSGPARTYNLTFYVRDRSDNLATLSHDVIVSDNLKPVIALRVPHKKFHVNQMSTDIQTTSSSEYLSAYKQHVQSDAYKNSDKQKFFEHEFEGARKSWEPQTGDRTKASELLNWEEDALMAESETKTNAWIVGAVVSATAGFILLAFSNKRQSVSIPV